MKAKELYLHSLKEKWRPMLKILQSDKTIAEKREYLLLKYDEQCIFCANTVKLDEKFAKKAIKKSFKHNCSKCLINHDICNGDLAILDEIDELFNNPIYLHTPYNNDKAIDIVSRIIRAMEQQL